MVSMYVKESSISNVKSKSKCASHTQIYVDGGSVERVMKTIGNAGVGQLSFGIAHLKGHPTLTEVVHARNAVR